MHGEKKHGIRMRKHEKNERKMKRKDGELTGMSKPKTREETKKSQYHNAAAEDDQASATNAACNRNARLSRGKALL